MINWNQIIILGLFVILVLGMFLLGKDGAAVGTLSIGGLILACAGMLDLPKRKDG